MFIKQKHNNNNWLIYDNFNKTAGLVYSTEENSLLLGLYYSCNC